MRRSRRLTETERWELGLFLGLLMLGCAGMAAMFQYDRIPQLFALIFRAPAPQAAPAAPASLPPTPAVVAPLPAIPPPVATLQMPPATLRAPGLTLPNLVPSITGDADRGEARLKPVKKPVEDVKWYKGQKFRYARTLKLRVTAYAADPRCCWPFMGTTTASGQSVKTNHGRLAAADTSVIPMYALVAVPGYDGGAAVPVLDRGGAIKGRRLDVLLPSYEKAQDWGVRELEVKIYLPVD